MKILAAITVALSTAAAICLYRAVKTDQRVRGDIDRLLIRVAALEGKGKARKRNGR